MLKRIEEYSDYREYLKDFYVDRKARFSYFSYRYFCGKAGIGSPSLFKEVVAGKRNLTTKTTHQFIKGLGLTRNDAQFFASLVGFTQANTAVGKQKFLDEMRGMRRRVTQKNIAIDQYEYFSKWYHQVVRELVCLIDWRQDYEFLAKSIVPRITAKQARESVQLLLDIGMVKIDKDRRYRQAHHAITTGSELFSVAVRSHNKKMASLGAEAVERFTPSERDVRSLTLGISRDTYELVKEEIREFKNRIIRLVDYDNNADSVYNLNVHFFPVSRRTDSEDG